MVYRAHVAPMREICAVHGHAAQYNVCSSYVQPAAHVRRYSGIGASVNLMMSIIGSCSFNDLCGAAIPVCGVAPNVACALCHVRAWHFRLRPAASRSVYPYTCLLDFYFSCLPYDPVRVPSGRRVAVSYVVRRRSV
ncbi:hypothetical protein EVAR_13393_1 [Eumeta japonica]|uniref:Uncharacterized protein n=1 Tax=Eumeta variegata TaxID=151549 RepID=A0A4C1TS00_EUMVA|nr:hypothetical protein EVAR_13393_1 [Eumeta japonica]